MQIRKSTKALLHILIICLLLHSCSNKNEELPEGIIAEDEMIQILTDVHLAETAFIMNNLKSKNPENAAISYYKFVFDKHKINREQFDASFRYYTARPAQYSLIYEQVLNEITQRQAHTIRQ
ncbi:MAG TPA: DUF4296 domain-containing protein [Bacteroidia bacterium]|nr:DUF4296 domain-containing protein [Bacteroidia bacterium]HNT79439.1 DUF4296 domain-containing protein [Bacteroidia bacterium]